MSYHEYRTMLKRRWLLVSAFLLFLSFVLGLAVAQAQPWPNANSKWKFKVTKSAGAEMTDPFWAHLHQGDAGFESVTLKVDIILDTGGPIVQDPNTIPPGNQLRYTVHGIPVSDWLSAPWTYVLDVTHPGLANVLDGIHDISFEFQGPNKAEIRPHPMYLHIHRGLPVDPTVPILARNHTTDYDDYGNATSPGVVYVKRTDRNHIGYPADPSVVPWHTPPHQADLYQEIMLPNSDLFLPVQMWWEEPFGTVSGGLSFVRGMPPKFGSEHMASKYDSVYGNPRDVNAFGLGGHRNFPFKDGPRGVGWASPFITGQVDSTGGLAFVEAGGPLRYMKADGELITVAGWRVKPGEDPVWFLKPLTAIRKNMELRGTWIDGIRTEPADRGFHYATDVAIDPQNENIWYVAGFGDNIIWKVVIADRVNWNATVSVFAGSITYQSGYANGSGTAARFNGPSSMVFDPICDCMYVTDQKNDAIRKITRAGVVSTLFGQPDMGIRLSTRGITVDRTGSNCFTDVGITECYNEDENRTVAAINVTAAQAASGIKPEIYSPMTVRVDSKGNLVVLEMGFASIRRLNPVTNEAKLLGLIPGRWQRFAPGWTWLDVDRWGNSGPLDSIYWLQEVASDLPAGGEQPGHINEVFAWLPAEGGDSQFVTGKDWAYPDGWGKLSETDAPHYPWMIAVDPRGALLLSGTGEHGITRVRMRRPSDPVPSNYFDFATGKELWLKGEPIGGHSFNFKFGHGGHNYLGFADTWGLKPGVTDAELITMFEIPQSIVQTPVRLAILLNFIRLNSGKQLGTAPPAPTDTQPPTMPTGLAVSNLTATSLTLSWTPSTDNVGVQSYRLTRTGMTPLYTLQTTHADTGLTPGTAYTYGVQARDNVGNVSAVAPLTVTTLPAVLPSEVSQTWERNNTKLVCTASGQFRTESLKMVDTCVKQFP